MKTYLYFAMLVVGLGLVGVQTTQASILYTSSQATIGVDQEITLDITIDADEPINTVELALPIPAQFEVSRTQDSGSIINLWVERPKVDQASNSLILSGLVPGGFAGLKGKIISVSLKARTIGEARFAFSSAQTRVLLNDGEGTTDPKLQLKTSIVTVGNEKVDIAAPTEDSEAPESFEPIVTQDPLLEEGKWVVIFQTQDKKSGLKEYQIQESKRKKPNDTAWQTAQSPYVLKDQTRGSYVFVKAVDYQGNERIEVIAPEGMSSGMKTGLLILLIILCLIIVRSVYLRYGKKRN
ncbi:MAG: hypothetical protein M3Q73_04320 [bacterium]|nr:hypothetical protein [bacterium]